MTEIYSLTKVYNDQFEPFREEIGIYSSKELAVESAKMYVEYEMKDQGISGIDYDYDKLVLDGYMDVNELYPGWEAGVYISLDRDIVYDSLDELKQLYKEKEDRIRERHESFKIHDELRKMFDVIQ